MGDGGILQAIDRAQADGKLPAEAHAHLRRWAEGEDYAAFHGEIAGLVRAGRWGELADAFGEVLVFGTGGRRGPMGVGPNRINDRTIAESAQGLAACLNATPRAKPGPPSAVIAHDTRHGSRAFAEQTAAVLAGNGVKALLFDGPRSTPELSFAVRRLGADAGVVISASHNPPGDNGFKAYWSDGGQVVPPHDRRIIEEVVRVGALRRLEPGAARAAGLLEEIGEGVDRAYVDYTAGLCLEERRGVGAVFTPLHGTGTTSVWPALRKAGFESLHPVEEQWSADGAFPAVPDHSPNPEYPAALEAGRALAERVGADLVLASDPDADRLGVLVRARGGWHFLSGNQIGVLLLEHVVERLASRGALPAGATVYKTIVTSDLIDRICAAREIAVRGDLLVGFKYVAEAIRGLPDPAAFVFGTEESHGYLRGAEVRDKDAAQAAVLLCERAAAARAEGRSLLDDLDAIHRRHGYARETTRAVRLTAGGEGGRGVGAMRALMESLRADPPLRLAGEPVAAVADHASGRVVDPATGRAAGEVGGARGDVLVFRLPGEAGDRVTIRPSGTEPKIKVYVQVHAGPSEPLEEARRRVDARAEALIGSIEALARERTADL